MLERAEYASWVHQSSWSCLSSRSGTVPSVYTRSALAESTLIRWTPMMPTARVVSATTRIAPSRRPRRPTRDSRAPPGDRSCAGVGAVAAMPGLLVLRRRALLPASHADRIGETHSGVESTETHDGHKPGAGP